MNKETIKKTLYIDSELVKKIKIKSAVDETTETNVVNEILENYFKKDGQKYSLKKE